LLSSAQATVARRQHEKVSGNSDDLAQIVIIIRIRHDNGLETQCSWRFPVDWACRMAALRCIIRTCEDMNKGAKWADMPSARG
jgi:hypothetical protein